MATKPVLLTDCVIQGDPLEGSKLFALAKEAKQQVICTFQWYRIADDKTEELIRGATWAYYHVTKEDVGSRLKVVGVPLSRTADGVVEGREVFCLTEKILPVTETAAPVALQGKPPLQAWIESVFGRTHAAHAHFSRRSGRIRQEIDAPPNELSVNSDDNNGEFPSANQCEESDEEQSHSSSRTIIAQEAPAPDLPDAGSQADDDTRSNLETTVWDENRPQVLNGTHPSVNSSVSSTREKKIANEPARSLPLEPASEYCTALEIGQHGPSGWSDTHSPSGGRTAPQDRSHSVSMEHLDSDPIQAVRHTSSLEPAIVSLQSPCTPAHKSPPPPLRTPSLSGATTADSSSKKADSASPDEALALDVSAEQEQHRAAEGSVSGGGGEDEGGERPEGGERDSWGGKVLWEGCGREWRLVEMLWGLVGCGCVAAWVCWVILPAQELRAGGPAQHGARAAIVTWTLFTLAAVCGAAWKLLVAKGRREAMEREGVERLRKYSSVLSASWREVQRRGGGFWVSTHSMSAIARQSRPSEGPAGSKAVEEQSNAASEVPSHAVRGADAV